MLGIILLRIEPIEGDASVRANPGRFVQHRMRIDTVVLHIDFGARDKERTSLMNDIKSAKVDIAAIHDIDGSRLQCDQIKCRSITHFTVGNMDETGIGPRRSSSVCILTAAFVERKSAQGNSDRHKSMVVLSSAYTVLARSRPCLL